MAKNDNVVNEIRFRKGKVKVAKFLIGLSLAGALMPLGKSIIRDAVYTSISYDDNNIEDNSVEIKERIDNSVRPDFYEIKDLKNMFIITRGTGDVIEEYYTVTEVSISDPYYYNSLTDDYITYGDYFLGSDNYNLFNDGSTKENNSIKLYIDLDSRVLVSVVNYTGDIKSVSKFNMYEDKMFDEEHNENPRKSFEEMTYAKEDTQILGFQIMGSIPFEDYYYSKEPYGTNSIFVDSVLLASSDFGVENNIPFGFALGYDLSNKIKSGKEDLTTYDNDDLYYDENELDSIYVAMKGTKDKASEYCILKEVSISDVCGYNITNNEEITYGEKYIGSDCYNIFNDGSTKENNNIKLYISLGSDMIQSAINYKGDIKDGSIFIPPTEGFYAKVGELERLENTKFEDMLYVKDSVDFIGYDFDVMFKLKDLYNKVMDEKKDTLYLSDINEFSHIIGHKTLVYDETLYITDDFSKEKVKVK